MKSAQENSPLQGAASLLPEGAAGSFKGGRRAPHSRVASIHKPKSFQFSSPIAVPETDREIGDASPRHLNLVQKSGRDCDLPPGRTGFLNAAFDLIVILTGADLWVVTPNMPTGTLLLGAIGLVGLWLLTGGILRYYDSAAYERRMPEDVSVASVLVFIATAFLGAVNLLFDPPPIVGVSRFLMTVWPFIVIARCQYFRRIASREALLQDVLIFGCGALARCTGEDLGKGRLRTVVGYVAVDGFATSAAKPVLGSHQDLEKILRSVQVSEVYIAVDPSRDGDKIRSAIEVCERLGVPFAIPACTFPLQRARASASDAVVDGYLHYQMVAVKPYQLAAKRLIDIVVSAVALIMLSPLLCVLGLIVKLTSPGPIFYRQLRVGLHRKTFEMLKFRSMVANADELKHALEARNERSGPVFKIIGDPRVTWIGRFMRRYSLDELPQLFNVLRGEMSLVGPRPPLPAEVARYEPWQLRRLSMSPGLTCSWQASADRYDISFEHWMYLDLQYIDHWSLVRDIELIARTIPVVLLGLGEG